MRNAKTSFTKWESSCERKGDVTYIFRIKFRFLWNFPNLLTNTSYPYDEIKQK